MMEISTRKRIEDIDRELSELRERHSALKAHWQIEKDTIQEIRGIKAEIERAKVEAANAERAGDLARVAEIRYGQIGELERKLEAANDKLRDIQSSGTMLKEEVTSEDIAEIVARWTGIPVQRMLESERTKLLHMEDRLRERVVGQDEALAAVSNAIRRSRAGLQDTNRPIGSFIFLGTTGVGKTELARSLAHFLFDDESAMVRIDMSEYMEKFAVSRLIGAPPGYVGYEEGGQLTEAVRTRPYSVILLDEIEKAHPDVFNVLLQVLDDGRLTDSQGRTVNFTNSIIIMTSNLGTELIREKLTDLENAEESRRRSMLMDLQDRMLKVLQGTFRPEFLNRVDEIILFNPLTRKEVRSIVEVQLNALKQRLQENGLALDISTNALEWLADKGYDIDFGARPLKRVIQRNLADPLAVKLLSGEISAGTTINVGRGADDKLEFSFSAAASKE